MHTICKYMPKICIKYARNMPKNARNMQKYARNMQKYASICRAVSAAEICKNIKIICNAYAKACKICNTQLSKIDKSKFRTLSTKCHQHICLSKFLWPDYLARYS